MDSYFKLRIEWRAFKESINLNDDFFKVLATLGYTPKGNFSLEVIKEVDRRYDSEQIQEIAKKNLIVSILEYVKDEQLLGVIQLVCTMKSRSEVRVTILPTSYSVYLNDRLDLIRSSIIWLIIIFLFFSFHVVKNIIL